MEYGFELLMDTQVAEVNSRARLYRHGKTGAQLLSVENDDENKAFGITFRTPPGDSSGVAHIMEHSVLCGSRKYPLKEPFVELIKGSLKTFLNAFTYPDRTCYPLASQNLQDFYNLIDVYLDSVFYPLIPPEILQQEGWHYELESPDGPLTYKGVVFNEMKGVYSSPDALLARRSQWSLFPETTYGFDSGGSPQAIPSLTYARFKAFHQTYYHPSNAFIYFYGDDDPEERLRRIGPWLEPFERQEVAAVPPLQARFAAPRREVAPYAAGEGEAARKSYVTVNWLIPQASDPRQTLAWRALAHILAGTPAAPLRKALVDSGLGEDVTGGSLQAELRQAFYSIGMKGVVEPPGEGAGTAGAAGERAGQVEALVLSTLDALARDGIDPETAAASLNTIEFSLRENNTGSFPRGLLLMLRTLPTWLYGGDPLEPLAFEAPLAQIRRRMEAGERYFEGLIRAGFLENPHRTTVILRPDPDLRSRQEAAEQERLAQARAAMSPVELEAVVESARKLKERQETPDTPEALALIPALTLADLDREIRRIPLEAFDLPGGGLGLFHDLFTNGIAYLDLGFDLRTLAEDDLAYIPLFGRALLETGTAKEDFVRFSQRIGRSTGGIWSTSYTTAGGGPVGPQAAPQAWLFLRGKATAAQAGELLAILAEALATARLDDRERIRQMALEEKSDLEAALVPAGHRLVNSRLRAQFNPADWAAEQMGGISSLDFLRGLAAAIEADWPGVLARFESLRARLVNRSRMLANVTLDGEHWQAFRPQLESFWSGLPSAAAERREWRVPPAPAREGLTLPAQVNYVGKGANLYDLGYRYHGSMAVINKYLGATWLWERVRVQGGAYGGFSSFDHHSGVYTFFSYRDPNLARTLQVFDETGPFLRTLKLDRAELERSIIGAIGDLDAYQLPDAKGFTSLARYLAGDRDEDRQRRRDQVLGATVEDFHRLGEALEAAREAGRVVVLGSQQAIDQARLEAGLQLETRKLF